MYFDWIGQHYSINFLSSQTGLASNDSGLTCYQLSNMINHMGGKSAVKMYNIQTLRDQLDKGLPTIVLITYGYIPGRQSSYTGGHFVVVVGYDDNYFYVNDPDYYGIRRNEGKSFKVPSASLRYAIERSPVPNQVIEIQG